MVAADRNLVIAGTRVFDLETEELGEPIDIEIREGVIRELGPARDRPDADRGAAVLDGRGTVALPGLVNAHLHSTGTFNRAFVDNLPLELFMLYELPPFDFGPFPPELYRTQAAWASAQMLKFGVTAVMDDAMFYPEPDDDTIDGLMEGYRDTGIRATVGVYLPDKVEHEWIPGLRDRLPPDVVERMDAGRRSTRDLVSLYERFIGRWHDRCEGRLRSALSCSAPQRATDAYIQALHGLSRRHDLRLVFHVYESKLQRISAEQLYGKSMIRHLRDLEVLDSRTIIVHAVWVDDRDIADLAEAGSQVVHSPCGNLRCGSGVMPYGALRSAGVPVALCTDEATVEDRGNLWNVGKLAGMLQTIADPDYRRWPRAGEILRAMTIGGAGVLGLGARLGRIAPDHAADLVLLDLAAIIDTPLAKLPTALVYGETAQAVRDVVVDGRPVVRNRELTTVDEHALAADVARWSGLWAEQVQDSVQGWAERLAPAYEEAYLRAVNTDAGVNRLVGDGGQWAGAHR